MNDSPEPGSPACSNEFSTPPETWHTPSAVGVSTPVEVRPPSSSPGCARPSVQLAARRVPGGAAAMMMTMVYICLTKDENTIAVHRLALVW